MKPPTATAGRARVAAILFIACACGWMVMELEILGGRVLAPHFGSSVYVWGSVIGVFLLSLSVGYMLGGWLSHSRFSRRLLGIALMAAGAWLVAMPRFTDPVCEGIFRLVSDEKWGSLLAALALFGVPTVLLGTVSPTAVRWLTHRASNSGLNAGLVLAVSTIASFAGCIVTAFYLVTLSIRHTIGISGVLLLALGGGVLAYALMHGEAKPPPAESEPERPALGSRGHSAMARKE